MGSSALVACSPGVFWRLGEDPVGSLHGPDYYD